MKKKYFLAIMLLSLMLVFTACGNSGAPSAAGSHSDNNASGDSDSSSQQRPRQQRPDLMGQVDSIVGNEVTLLMAEMPQPDPQSGQRDVKNPPSDSQTGDQKENQPTEDRTDRIKEMIKLTGETQKIVIPEGTPINSGWRNENTTLKLSDIQKGMLLQIWFAEDDGSGTKTVKQVRVMATQ